MKRSSAPIQLHWWDWTSVFLLFTILQVTASRLVVTKWTPFLYLVPLMAFMGFVIGASGGYSLLQRSTVRWLSFLYLIILLPLQLTRTMDEQIVLEEQLLSVFGRVLFSISEFVARRPVEDPLFFVTVMCIAFWALSASAGYQLIRHQSFLAAILPSAVGIIIIQNYDNVTASRIWLLAIFILLALLQLGRLNFLQDQKRWRERRVFLSPENSIDLTTSMAIVTVVIILTAWLTPASFLRNESARRAWKELTQPITNFLDRMENAVKAIDGPGNRPGEFYGTELELGSGFPLSDTVMFTVQVPELTFSERPPRYYWRGRVYDYFKDGQWYMTNTARETYSPQNIGMPVPDTQDTNPQRFVFTAGEARFSLVYLPSEAIWFSRPGSMLVSFAGETEREVATWNATPTILAGETYQVEAALKNPNIQQLREAGQEYPQWVTEKYLQLPVNFSPNIRQLAFDITADAETPYDKASAITRYLRENIKYAATIPTTPTGIDPLEWVLFEHKEAYCVYYASAEVLMLRSLGIPARMAVGFSQGTGTSRGEGLDEEVEEFLTNEYTVRKKNAHAWPEVYFPGIGWVEFEPTGNQTPLDRPQPLRAGDNPAPQINPLIPDIENNIAEQNQDDVPDPLDPNAAATGVSPLSTLYLILLLSALAALTVFLSRRYKLTERLPSLARTTLERGGFTTPRWLIHWDGWTRLTAIQKSFESINFGLRQLASLPAPDATPSERANSLVDLLPHSAPEIKLLLDEHQTSLYTPRPANPEQARKAALKLRMQVLIARWRYFWTGSYAQKP